MGSSFEGNPKILRVHAVARVCLQFPYRTNPQGKPANVVLNKGDTYDLDSDDIVELDSTVKRLYDEGQITTEVIGYGVAADGVGYDTGSGVVSLQSYLGTTPQLGTLPVVYGTRSSPVVVTAAGGIAYHSNDYEVQWVVSNGGPISISANPAISSGSKMGQRIALYCVDTVNTIQLASGNGLDMPRSIVLGDPTTRVVEYFWDADASLWFEDHR